ncbi:MAG TPA: metallophosphoesterase [Bacillota bacterium]|nr:metallophosphoesterase [Bacillota bacterium]
MDTLTRLSQVYNAAETVPFDDSSKIILMSDIHRGTGDWTDNFSRNQNIYYAALNHYYNEGYTYIEIGDGDELWENDNISEIIEAHRDVFWLLQQFFLQGRLYLIFGNHDMVKKDYKFAQNKLSAYFQQREKEYTPFLPNIRIHEGLVLKHRVTDQRLFLVHGHQVEFLNYTLWRVARFLVRYLWRPLELVGLQDPTSTANNPERKEPVEKRLTEWVKRNQLPLIAGHTHRSMFPKTGEPPYFNCGSAVHLRCITGIELEGGNITLVKWNVKTRGDGTLYIGREVLAGPRKLAGICQDM